MREHHYTHIHVYLYIVNRIYMPHHLHSLTDYGWGCLGQLNFDLRFYLTQEQVQVGGVPPQTWPAQGYQVSYAIMIIMISIAY